MTHLKVTVRKTKTIITNMGLPKQKGPFFSRVQKRTKKTGEDRIHRRETQGHRKGGRLRGGGAVTARGRQRGMGTKKKRRGKDFCYTQEEFEVKIPKKKKKKRLNKKKGEGGGKEVIRRRRRKTPYFQSGRRGGGKPSRATVKNPGPLVQNVGNPGVIKRVGGQTSYITKQADWWF